MSMKSGFLKGLIYKDTGPTGDTKTPVSATSPSSAPVQILNAPTVTVQGVADNRFIELLEKVIEQNNLPGQDYFEFKQSVENMKQIAADEKTKFQMAYAVLSVQGCKKDILISSLDKYVSIIQQEKTNFDAEMKAAYTEKVQSKLAEAEKAKKELEALSKKLNELNSSIQTASQEAQAEEMKIRATEANIKASADIIIAEMVGDKEKITSFIN